MAGVPDERVLRRKRAAARARRRGNEERALVALEQSGKIGPVFGGPRVPVDPPRPWSADDFDTSA